MPKVNKQPRSTSLRPKLPPNVVWLDDYRPRRPAKRQAARSNLLARIIAVEEALARLGPPMLPCLPAGRDGSAEADLISTAVRL
jgi:hypothetical protein